LSEAFSGNVRGMGPGVAELEMEERETESVKPRLARLADRIVGYFTWIVLGLAIATFSYWSLLAGNPQMAIVFMAAVLTVACPCALGIATPLVVSIAVLKASRITRGTIAELLKFKYL